MKAKAFFILTVGTTCLYVLWAPSLRAGSEMSVTRDENKTAYSIKSTESGVNESRKGEGDTFNTAVSPIGQGKGHGHHKGQHSGSGGFPRKPHKGQHQSQPPAPGGPPGKPMGDQEQGQLPGSGGQLHF